MLLLPRPDVDIGSLRIGMRLQLGRLRGVVVDFHVIHANTGETFHTCLEAVGKAGAIRASGGGRVGLATLGNGLIGLVHLHGQRTLGDRSVAARDGLRQLALRCRCWPVIDEIRLGGLCRNARCRRAGMCLFG